MNSKIVYSVLIVLLIVAICIAAGTFIFKSQPVINLEQNPEVFVKENTITVKGEGKISLKPDVAYINVGVDTFNKDARKAQEENKQTMTKVMNKLKELGIEEKDQQTSAYNIWPQYEYHENKEILTGYRVESMLRVTIRNVDKVGDILNGVNQAGANKSYEITFGVLDTDAVYQQALEKAIDDAKCKADVLAKQAGIKLGRPVAIYEGNAPDDVYQYERAYRSANKAAMDVAEGAAVPIAPGELEVQATITVVYKTN